MKQNKPVDMSPEAIRRRLIELARLYDLGKKIKKAKKITPDEGAPQRRPPGEGRDYNKNPAN